MGDEGEIKPLFCRRADLWKPNVKSRKKHLKNKQKIVLEKQSKLWYIDNMFILPRLFSTLIFSATIAFSIFPQTIQAKEVIFGTDLNFRDETLDTNYYISGGNIRINSNFNQDLIIAGTQINLEGVVEKDTTILGGEVFVNNYTKGDLRVIGGLINFNGTVEGDLIIIGGTVKLLKDANILGETLIIGGRIRQDATLLNKTGIIATSVTMNNEVKGNSEITTQNMIFDSGAKILGNLYYYAPIKAQEKPGAELSGNIYFNQISTLRETGVIKRLVINVISFWIILKFITTLILAFILVQMFKVFAQGVSNFGTRSFIKSFAVGLLSLIAVPMIFGILAISLIGLPIGLLMILIYIIIWSLSAAVSGILLGNIISHILDKNPEMKVTFSNSVLGIIMLTIVQFLPFIGDLTLITFTFISIGAMIRYISSSLTNKRST